MTLALYDFLDLNLLKGVNTMILTIPGLGISHHLADYAKNKEINYINEPNQTVAKYNILDLDANKREDFLDQIDRYFRQKYQKTELKPVFAVVINQPRLISQEEYQLAYFSSHIYKTFVNQPLTVDQANEFMDRNGLDKKRFEDIYSLGNGIPRLMKFLALNQNYLDDYKTIMDNEEFKKILLPTIKELSNCPKEIEKHYDSQLINFLIKSYQKEHPEIIKTSIVLDLSRLTIKENQMAKPRVVTLTEIKLIKWLIDHDLVISRDQIGEIKWKKDSYNKFSDQAINTTITRLNRKLKYYQLKPISGVGYQLVAEPKI